MIAALLTGSLLLALLLLVMAPALRELRWPTDVTPLNVPHDHDNAAERFALQYRARLEQAMQGPLAAMTQQLDADDWAARQGLQWCAPGEQVETSTRPLVGAGNLLLAPDTRHAHEVYAVGDLRLAPGASARAAFADRDLQLDAGASVERWAHARAVSLASQSKVGARVTAEQFIRLAPGARFVRACAPTIEVAGAAAAPPLPAPTERQRFAGAPGAHFDVRGGRWVVDGDLHLPAGTEVDGDLIVRGDARLASGCRIRGSLKVHGRLRLGEACVIDGACVVVGAVDVGAAASVAGPLVGEGRVLIGRDATIGRVDSHTSVNGRVIALKPGATVHGSIWAKVGATARA
jgi:hypothetical protein